MDLAVACVVLTFTFMSTQRGAKTPFVVAAAAAAAVAMLMFLRFRRATIRGSRTLLSVEVARCSSKSRTLLSGKGGVYCVTGAEAGLGLATTAALVDAGATVVMGCADLQKGQTVASTINGVTGKQSAVACGALDLGSRQSIREFCSSLQHLLDREGERLEGLVHHAGVMGLGTFTPTADGEEAQWAYNYAGPFRLTLGLWSRLVSDDTKVICLTSTSHCTPDKPLDLSAVNSKATYNGWGAYQQSKLATLLFSNELNRRLAVAGSGATSRAVCENDKYFYLPQLLLPDDKAALSKGPTTTLAALSGLGGGGSYLVDAQVGIPGQHGQSEADARRLWEWTLARL